MQMNNLRTQLDSKYIQGAGEEQEKHWVWMVKQRQSLRKKGPHLQTDSFSATRPQPNF